MKKELQRPGFMVAPPPSRDRPGTNIAGSAQAAAPNSANDKLIWPRTRLVGPSWNNLSSLEGRKFSAPPPPFWPRQQSHKKTNSYPPHTTTNKKKKMPFRLCSFAVNSNVKVRGGCPPWVPLCAVSPRPGPSGFQCCLRNAEIDFVNFE